MSWFSQFFTNNITSILSSITNTVDQFHLSKEEKHQFQLAMEKIIQDKFSETEKTIRQELSSREKILVAELNQGDTYTKRARPTVVYFGLLMIGCNYLIVPLATQLLGIQMQTITLPTEFWVAWGGVVSTWSVGRSFEKGRVSNKFSQAAAGKQ
ncbi:3TM-type holin [Spartinivicinus poritis]|uniref:3TM-type holin n=1 Tax=Spartinivicinus poritis TaxID=2994640 RepID=A0ABT5U301_9GAMM|nr:3TM-type holin [Spartinivicinus sp. A2-2]MDE1460749.1 3TM-type holin [Spartinivicinus sp. A2-2]